MSVSGSLLFAKYAYSPNKFGYCGPRDNRAIFDYCVAQQSDKGLVELLEKFEGAYPYLKLIARTNNIKDPLDKDVVEAYWIGNNLLVNVSVGDFYNQLKERFAKKLDAKTMKWLISKPPIGAKPHHSFHVLDVYTKTGLIRSGYRNNVIETINNCLISWGRVEKIDKDTLMVQYRPVVFRDGKVTFGDLSKKKIFWQFKKPQIGGWISLHWGMMCDFLDRRQLANLQKWTKYHLDIANRTI